MARSRADEILEGWKLIANTAPRPEYAPTPARTHDLPLGSLMALAGIVLVIVVAARMQQQPGPTVGSSTTPSVSPTASASSGQSIGVIPVPTGAASAGPTGLSSPASSPTSTSTSKAGPTAPPSSAASTSAGATPSTQDAEDAKVMMGRYLSSLVAGDYQGAYSMLAPTDRAKESFADFKYERAAAFQSVKGQYTVTAWPKDEGTIADWLTPDNRSAILLDHAVLLEVDYPALAGNNAGWELYVVSRDAGDRLWIFRVR